MKMKKCGEGMLKRFSSKTSNLSNNVVGNEDKLIILTRDYRRALHDKYENDSNNEFYIKESYKAGLMMGQVLEIRSFRAKFNKGKIENVKEAVEMLANGEKFVREQVKVYENKIAKIK